MSATQRQAKIYAIRYAVAALAFTDKDAPPIMRQAYQNLADELEQRACGLEASLRIDMLRQKALQRASLASWAGPQPNGIGTPKTPAKPAG